MELMEPFSSQLDLLAGTLEPSARILRRHLSDMQEMYADREGIRRMLEGGQDPLIYEVYLSPVPEVEGQLPYSTTIIYPGKVGHEFFMTKGHFHVKRDRAEIYLGLAGEGHLVMQKEDGTVRSQRMAPGTAAYVPPFWAHRTVNTGTVPFAFFAVWPGDAGHDYRTIETTGFAKMMVSRNGRAVLVDNARYR